MKKCPVCTRSFGDEIDICDFDGNILHSKQPAPDPYLGRVLRERYKIIEKIRQSSMSDIYLAEQLLIGRRVLVKIVRPEHASDETYIKRFRQEAKLISSLNHARLIQLFDFDQEPDGSFFIVTEYAAGKSLRDFLKESTFEIPKALRFAIQISEGLDAAHAAGVIHRDINPGNIIVSDDRNNIKITDFAFAQSREFEATIRLTQAGIVLGDPCYIAPEQIDGSDTDARTDIYSLGVILYEMLCGKVPFNASSPTAIWMKHLNEPPVPPSRLRQEVPPSVDEIVLRALHKSPDERWARMSQLAEALSTAASDFSQLRKPQDETMGRAPARAPTAPAQTQASVMRESRLASDKQPAMKHTASQTVVIESSEAASLLRSSDATAADSMSKTMVLTQALEPVHRDKSKWAWLAIGIGTIVALGFISWMFLFPDSDLRQQEASLPSAAEAPESPPPKPVQLSSIAVDADKMKVAVGEAASLRLTGRYDDGSIKPLQNEDVDWKSSNPSVASADFKGRITAKKAGTTKFTTRYMGLETSSIAIVVVAKAIDDSKPAALIVRASRSELNVNERLRLQVLGRHGDGRQNEMKTGIHWESSAPEIASVDAKGTVIAKTGGSAQLTARYGELTSAPFALMVKPVADAVRPPAAVPPAIQPKSPAQPVKTTMVEERIRIARAHMDRGEYAEALGELDKASKIDPTNKDVQSVMSDTRRACNAEKRLGRSDLKC